ALVFQLLDFDDLGKAFDAANERVFHRLAEAAREGQEFGGGERPAAHPPPIPGLRAPRSEEHTSELQSLAYLVCRLLPEKKKNKTHPNRILPTCISSDLSNAYAQPTPQHTPYKNPIHFAEADPLGLRLSFLLDPLIVATC